jgi:hypothetical protein
MKILNIVESAYRATLEEQDDTIIWLVHALKGAGADVDVVLSEGAVYYGLEGQSAKGLKFGDWSQSQPPELAEDVAKLMEKGSTVYIVEDDAARRGLEPGLMIAGLKPTARKKLGELVCRYDQVWYW